ncbi:amino acid permease [Pseudonocardia acaciae]|uniref:amino acid permease n=1 Tax=Pseudonocardia acaciae TaxID=551276 RepID=UPI00048D2E78|nr:amino acid permease [Pseudonocardia acaciae]
MTERVAVRDSDLSRSLTTRQMAMLGLGAALGTGLFLGAGSSISIAGPSVMVSYAVGALVAGAVAFALAEMTSAQPVRGAFGTIAARYLGPFAGFASRWVYWLALVCAIGSEVVAAATYLRFWWPAIPLWVGVVVFSLIITGVNLATVSVFGSTEAVLAGIKVLAVLVFIVLGVVLVAFGLPGQAPTGLGNWTATGGFAPNGWSAVWLVMAVVVFSFAGIELVAISAAEAKEPAESMRVAMRSLIIRLGLFYLVAIGVMLAVRPWTELGQAHGVQASPFVAMFAAAGIPAAATITNFVVLLTALSAANANLYAATRMLHSLAHDGFAFRPLRHATAAGQPRRAALVSAVGLLVAAILAAYAPAQVFGLLLSLASFTVIAVWIISLSTLIAFRRHPDRGESSTRLPGGLATPVVAILILLSVYATGIFVPDMQLACLVGVPFLILVGVVYAVFFRRRAVESTQA